MKISVGSRKGSSTAVEGKSFQTGSERKGADEAIGSTLFSRAAYNELLHIQEVYYMERQAKLLYYMYIIIRGK